MDTSLLHQFNLRKKIVWAVGVIVLIIVFRLALIQSVWFSKREGVLIPNQTSFRDSEINVQAVKFLSQRWGVAENQIYMIVQDSEPWMQVLGLLDLQTLSSARIWIIDISHREGQSWKDNLEKQNTLHENDIYLISEYRPQGQNEKALAAKFYSNKTFWYGCPFGRLAIIEGIRWTDIESGLGTIIAYQSQKYLPSITIPIKNNLPQKWKASQTPIH